MLMVILVSEWLSDWVLTTCLINGAADMCLLGWVLTTCLINGAADMCLLGKVDGMGTRTRTV